jgi:7,8-dihydropterin-6-yl-methyl-4-(beta-D-ribofuranosyl)aminobenzene 5'-phosphate synthase
MQKLLTLLAACSLALVLTGGTVCATDTGNWRMSVLCDDKAASEKFMPEHGVSVLLDLPNGKRWLFDTGATDAYLVNAERMGISLDNLTGIAISHGHYDHTGGLMFYPRLKGEPPIYGHPYIWHKQYEVKNGAPTKVVGMPDMARRLSYKSFKPVNNVTKLDDDLYFFTDIPRELGSFAPHYDKFFNEDGTGPCPIIDDATIVLKTSKGLVAIFGCGHAGYVNILKAIEKEFPGEKFAAVVGGLHLKEADEKVLADAAAYTDKIKGPDFVFACSHCTGENTIEYFKKKYGDQVVKPLGAGSVVEFAAVGSKPKAQ